MLIPLAVALDLALGEPPLAAHPTRWFGKIVEVFDRRDYGRFNLAVGTLCVLSCVSFALVISLAVPYPLSVFWHLYLLFSAVSVKSMVQHARRCLPRMESNAVQMLVSRRVEDLSYSQRCSAVIESIAENFVDGFFAPLFYFSLLGLPGAMVYKAVNVCDAMIGYRKGKYEEFGKFAAKLDDALNFIPSRLSLLFFEVLKRGSLAYGLKMNPKLNGCSIAAMSYVLGVKLEKRHHYTLPGKEAGSEDVERAIGVYYKLCAMATVFCTMLSFLTARDPLVHLLGF
ncbi:MAG: adenosylcobinamide-phosphate synthase CbiB [Archaeoglobaceae archaeon]